MPLKYWALIIVMGIAWGTSFLFNEILMRELGPLSISLGRVGLGALGCWIYAIAMGKSLTVPLRLLGGLMLLGAFNFAIPFAIYPLSQQHIASGVAGIVNAMTPVMVVIVSHFWPNRETATRTKTIGVVFGIIGIVILISPSLSGALDTNLYAILFTLLAPVCYAIAFNLAPKYKTYDPTIIAALALTGGALAIAPLAFYMEGLPSVTRVETWLALAIIGFALTSATFIVMYRILPIIGTTNASIPTMIAPVSAVVLGTYVLGEDLGSAHFIGMAVIIIGMLIIDGRIVARFRGS